MNNQIVLVSLAGAFLFIGLILIVIFVIFVAFPKLTARVTANQTWSKRYRDVTIREFGRYKKVDMTKCNYVYQTAKKSYRFKMEFYRKTQRQSPLRVSVTYIKAFPRLFYVHHPHGLGVGIYLLVGIVCILMTVALLPACFS